MFARLKKFDAYPKTLEDFRVKTFTGAAVSIVAGVLMLSLFASELNFYLTKDVQPELFVDTSRNEKMRINLDVTFPKMPCSLISIDVMDVSGEQQLDVEHNLYKRRLSKDGEVVEEEKQEELGHPGDAGVEVSTADPDLCESCYGAESGERKCCNTCAEVQSAYQAKGWAFTDGEGIAQCEREGWTNKIKEQEEEGCNMYGFLEVNKVSGNFHFAPGKSFQQQNVHIHDLQGFGRRVFNMTHTIKALSFGHEYPGMENPLDEHVEIALDEGSAMYQYFTKIVPTTYRKISGQEIKTNQYSVTTHKRVMDPARGEVGLPGVFFMFELSPILVQLTESRRSFMHFLTSLCAIIGGVFTVAGMVDGIIYQTLRVWEKNRLGKN